MGELVTIHPELRQIVDQVLPEDVQEEDDGTEQYEGPGGDGGEEEETETPAADRRTAAKRKGRELFNAASRDDKTKARASAKQKAAEQMAGTMATTLVRGMTPLFTAASSGSSRWTEATQKTESELAQLDLRTAQFKSHQFYSEQLAKLREAGEGESFPATFLQSQLKTLEASMMPPQPAAAAATNGGGAGSGGGAGGASSNPGADDGGGMEEDD